MLILLRVRRFQKAPPPDHLPHRRFSARPDPRHPRPGSKPATRHNSRSLHSLRSESPLSEKKKKEFLQLQRIYSDTVQTLIPNRILRSRSSSSRRSTRIRSRCSAEAAWLSEEWVAAGRARERTKEWWVTDCLTTRRKKRTGGKWWSQGPGTRGPSGYAFPSLRWLRAILSLSSTSPESELLCAAAPQDGRASLPAIAGHRLHPSATILLLQYRLVVFAIKFPSHGLSYCCSLAQLAFCSRRRIRSQRFAIHLAPLQNAHISQYSNLSQLRKINSNRELGSHGL